MGLGIAVDGSGAMYVTGSTASTNFPTQNPITGTFQGGATDVAAGDQATPTIRRRHQLPRPDPKNRPDMMGVGDRQGRRRNVVHDHVGRRHWRAT